MIVKDILPYHPIKKIEVRTYDPNGEDMLLGYCAWNGRSLISLDGDNYSVSEVVKKYEWHDDMLVYWVNAIWS